LRTIFQENRFHPRLHGDMLFLIVL
jgi:hypothetical protein